MQETRGKRAGSLGWKDSPKEFPFQYPIILPFHTVHGVLKARKVKWFAIPFSSGPHSVRPLHHDPPILGGPTRHAWLSFIELDKAVVLVIRLASFLWLWFQCVCPLMPSCNTYHLIWVSLTLDVGYLFTAAPAKCSCCPLPWTRGISSLAHPPDLERGVAPLGPPWRAAAAPWMWGGSSPQVFEAF